ncbi:199_t:CDS:2 [Dentiscutata erythropus]|uniref:199_t:CDS:1 n=1 Tax=Dentiscutata erythropus TaxID=1348616 RepID=A0A9N8VKQ9_9GLOM|nr:199_t:CDS:2 [Dentiscutata erythropus]
MASTSSDTVSPVTSLNYRPAASCNSPPRVSLKTSLTHPINISWIVPEELLEGLSLDPLSGTIDLFDVYTTASLYQHYYETVRNTSQTLQRRGSRTYHSPTLIGNLALSSCPGKKVRLNGPVRGRATIDRDLDLDFQRLKSSDISMIICCLNDEELAFLGVPWPKYCELAQKHNLQIIRIPMVEGGCPDTMDQMDQVVMQMDRHIQSGQRVLAHCRGGVGRAGLVACCWLLKIQFCCDADRAIRFVRMRRSPKAIETIQQVDFIVKYADYTNRKPMSHRLSHDVNNGALNTVTKFTQ